MRTVLIALVAMGAGCLYQAHRQQVVVEPWVETYSQGRGSARLVCTTTHLGSYAETRCH